MVLVASVVPDVVLAVAPAVSPVESPKVSLVPRVMGPVNPTVVGPELTAWVVAPSLVELVPDAVLLDTLELLVPPFVVEVIVVCVPAVVAPFVLELSPAPFDVAPSLSPQAARPMAAKNDARQASRDNFIHLRYSK
ncbi:MAG: hypothetical protein H6713_42975 [Myxococcales bacterium]|nr:hypothetical protein [Myxococcales bacterium]MCB9756729.1 hypothetical protein [Myxococcales bacterium]